MARIPIISLLSTVLFLVSTPSFSQDELSSISFESIPGGTRFVADAGESINLEADTDVLGDLAATGEITPGIGVRFPDGTLQTTASTVGAGAPGDAGLYNNKIADVTPPLAYTEVCIKNGEVTFDIHADGEPTAGGNCLPGDTGWIIERFERSDGNTFTWINARMECLQSGMRLPEVFEWQYTCQNGAVLAVSDLEDDEEWASNAVQTEQIDFGSPFLGVYALGNGSCSQGRARRIASNNTTVETSVVRCAL